jgi:hypothetical protein
MAENQEKNEQGPKAEKHRNQVLLGNSDPQDFKGYVGHKMGRKAQVHHVVVVHFPGSEQDLVAGIEAVSTRISIGPPTCAQIIRRICCQVDDPNKEEKEKDDCGEENKMFFPWHFLSITPKDFPSQQHINGLCKQFSVIPEDAREEKAGKGLGGWENFWLTRMRLRFSDV